MSLRSAATALLLVVAVAVAQWSDLIMITYYNATPVKMCALDRPHCVYVIKLNFTDYSPNTTSIFWMYPDWRYIPPWKYGGSLPDTALLQALYYNNQQQQGPLTIEVPKSGYLYSDYQFYVDNRSSDTLTVCGKHYRYIAPVSKGTHTLTKFYPIIYFLDPATCVSYLVVGLSWYSVRNITVPWALVYIMHMPTGRRVLGAALINGTRHIYRANIAGDDFWPVGRGVYLGSGVYLPTIATTSGGAYIYDYWFWYGPVPYENYTKLTRTSRAVWYYTIGADLSDGVTYIRQPAAIADISYVSSDGSAGYLRFDSVYSYVASGRRIVAYMRRYSIVEVAMTDKQGYVYGARTIACPTYPPSSPAPPDIMPFRLDIAKQLELCNNSTRTLYVALYVSGMYYYNFIDELEPGQCRMVWFDGTRSSSDIIYYFYNSSAALCLNAPNLRGAVFSVRGLAPWYRYYIMSNNTVRQGPPINPDLDYYSAWLNITQWLAQQYNATLNALLNRLKQRQYNATQALQSFIASQPQFVGTIRVGSATSTWLKTVYSELQKWRVAAPAVGGAVSVRLQAPSALTASAAAVAVATAWAASRRSLATAAFLAGFAVLATALFVAALYGATVMAALVMAAVVLMAVGAAAAWQKQTGEE